MAYEFAIIEKKEHLWIITLNRPERMNALHSPAHKELDEIFNNNYFIWFGKKADFNLNRVSLSKVLENKF